MGGDETWILSPQRMSAANFSQSSRRFGNMGKKREEESLINNGRVLSVHIYQRMLSYRRFSLHIFLHTKSSHGNIESDQFFTFFKNIL